MIKTSRIRLARPSNSSAQLGTRLSTSELAAVVGGQDPQPYPGTVKSSVTISTGRDSDIVSHE